VSYPPSYPPPPEGPPAYTYPHVPGPYQVSRNLWLGIGAVIVIVVLLLGVMGYVFVGFAYASTRISDAASAVNSASAHRGYVNNTFDLLQQQVSSIGTVMDNKMGKSNSGQLVSESQLMSRTVAGDDQSLAAARRRLHDQRWLTSITSSGRLAGEAARVDLARKAVAAIRSAAADYVQLGEFLQAYYQAMIDWDTLLADAKNNDFVGAAGADSLFSTDLASALQISNAPGLPVEFNEFLVAVQAYATDIGKVLNAIAARDKNAFDAADKLVLADLAKANAIDITSTPTKINSYYKHYRDDFNSDMDKATA